MAAERTELVEIEAPLDGAYRGVVRLIVGAIAEQAAFGYEAMDDLQLAVERLLAEAGEEGRVKLDFELAGGGCVRVRIGPLPGERIGELLEQPAGEPGTLGLRRILSTVVDSFGIEPAGDGRIVVRMEKRGTASP